MAKLLSGKVGVTTFAGLSTSRSQIVGGQPTFIGLDEVEPNLGLSPQNDTFYMVMQMELVDGVNHRDLLLVQ